MHQKNWSPASSTYFLMRSVLYSLSMPNLNLLIKCFSYPPEFKLMEIKLKVWCFYKHVSRYIGWCYCSYCQNGTFSSLLALYWHSVLCRAWVWIFQFFQNKNLVCAASFVWVFIKTDWTCIISFYADQFLLYEFWWWFPVICLH